MSDAAAVASASTDCYIDSVPDELLLKIFEMVFDASYASGVVLFFVCRRWLRLWIDPSQHDNVLSDMQHWHRLAKDGYRDSRRDRVLYSTQCPPGFWELRCFHDLCHPSGLWRKVLYTGAAFSRAMMDDANTSLMEFFLPPTFNYCIPFHQELPTLAFRGHVHVLRWLKENLSSAFANTTKYDMYGPAVASGELQVFKDVRELMSDSEKSEASAIDNAVDVAGRGFHNDILRFLLSLREDAPRERSEVTWQNWMVNVIDKGNIEAMRLLRRHVPYREHIMIVTFEALVRKHTPGWIADSAYQVKDQAVALLISWILDPDSNDDLPLVSDLMYHNSSDISIIERYDEGALLLVLFHDWAAEDLLRKIIRTRRAHYLNGYTFIPSDTPFSRPLKRSRTL